ncbi:MAG TPA: fibronectin type III domain-containing protein [Gemmatimonadales bacterium]|jgi:hypothetical protein
MPAPTPATLALAALGFVAAGGTPLLAQVPLRTRANTEQPRLMIAAAAAAPTGIQVAQVGPAVTVSWQPVAEQAGYRVYRAPDQTAFAELTRGPIGATTFPDSTAAAGSTYYYRVAAEYPDGRLGTSDPVAFTVPVAVAAQLAMANPIIARRVAVLPPGPPPSGLAAVPAPTSVALSWTALLNVNGYRIERSLGAATGQWATVTTVPALAFTDTGLDPDVPVQYRVTAEYADGRQGTSNPISTRTTKPANPANLRATVATRVINAQITPTWNASTVASGDVTLTWDPVPGAAHYELSGTGLSIPKSVPAATYTVAELPPGLARYQVVAYFLNGTRRYSDAANPAKVEAFVGPRPVSNLTGESHVSPSAEIILRWTGSPGSPTYKVLRADAQSGPYREITGLSWYNNMVGDGSPARGRSYFYKVFSVFPSGPIASSATIRVDVPPQVTINNFTGSSPAPNTVRLSWDPVPGAVEFTILRGYAPNGTMDWIQRDGTTMKLMGYATGYTAVEGRGYTYKYRVCVKTNIQDSGCSGTVSVAVTQ